MIDFSKKRQARANAEGVDVRKLAVAELMAWGWDATDALLAVGLIRECDEKSEAAHVALSYTMEKAFSDLYKKRTKQMRNGCVLDEYQRLHPTPNSRGSNRGRPRADGTVSAERKRWQGEVAEPVPDEEILAAMWETITKLEPKDPKRVDLLDKYDKLKRRQGNNGDDDATIHFYLPRPECDTCPFKGDHIITEPEALAMAGEDDEPEEEPEIEPEEEDDEEEKKQPPRPGYSIHGKKLGRPRKRRYKKREPKTEVQS